MKIQFVDLKAQYHSIKDEVRQAMDEVMESSAFIGGKFVEQFEKQFAACTGVKHCIGVGNGTDALFISLKALGIGPGDEVITAANSFIATSEAITATGAEVVFVDCDPRSYNIDAGLIGEKIGPRTKAILPVHLYGQPADMDAISNLAKKHGLFVVEDAAQAHLAGCRGKTAGSFGDIGCFSFYPGKNLGAYGDAGAVVTHDDRLALECRMFANHGRTSKYDHEFEGINSRLDGLQAAVLLTKLKHLEKWTERRRAVAAMYDEGLKGTAAVPEVMPGAGHAYHLYVVRVKNRTKVMSALNERGVSTGVHYPIPLPFLKAYSRLGHKPGDFPVAWSLKDEIMSLPMHADMTDEQVGYVIQQVKEIVKEERWAA